MGYIAIAKLSYSYGLLHSIALFVDTDIQLNTLAHIPYCVRNRTLILLKLHGKTRDRVWGSLSCD